MDVLLEVTCAFFLCLLGQLIQMGPLLEIQANAINRREIMAPPYLTRDFDSYNTRLGLFEAAKARRLMKKQR